MKMAIGGKVPAQAMIITLITALIVTLPVLAILPEVAFLAYPSPNHEPGITLKPMFSTGVDRVMAVVAALFISAISLLHTIAFMGLVPFISGGFADRFLAVEPARKESDN